MEVTKELIGVGTTSCGNFGGDADGFRVGIELRRRPDRALEGRTCSVLLGRGMDD